MLKKYSSSLLFLILIYSSLFSQTLNPVVADIPMRDGKTLKADIYLPDTVGTYPVILIQTPYSRLTFRLGLPLGIRKDLANSPYAFVIVDWRCFFGSSAACVISPNRGEDGYDVVEWIASQFWSNARIGTWGPSALGKIQFQTARENPPSLDCIAPLVAGSQTQYLEIFPGGAARTEYIEQLDGLGFGLSGIYYANPVKNIVWTITENSTFYPDKIKVPTMMIGGWYDHNVNVMTELFDALQKDSEPAVRDKHRLLMGPWVHGGTGPAYVGSSQQGELDFPEAAGWSDSLVVAFFDYWLRDIGNNWDSSPKVQYFQMGERQWESSPNWPPNNTFEQSFFLHSDKSIQSFENSDQNGELSFNYDPQDPSPTHGGPTLKLGLTQGPLDQRDTVEGRNDILSFTSDPLQKPLVVKGKPKILLYVSSDRLDTDFAIRLTNVYPDGRSMLLSDGIQRMRFRDGYAAADTSMMIPGTIYPITIELPDLAHTFMPGHQIRLNISSSNYPRFNRNMNTGGEMYPNGNGDTLVNPLIAYNTIHLNTNSPSQIILPVTDSVFTALESNNFNIPILAFPNPTKGKVQIQLPNKIKGEVQLTLLDLMGKEIWSKKKFHSPNSLIDIDLSNGSQGTYFLSIRQKNQIGMVILIKI